MVKINIVIRITVDLNEGGGVVAYLGLVLTLKTSIRY